MSWNLEPTLKRMPKLNRPILIEGLPGIGNVGKVTVDFLIDKLHAKKLYDINSNTMPHSVFVNESNLIDLPSIELYYVKSKTGKDLLILTGDVQPVDEISCHEFCYKILKLCEKFRVKQIITLGGIGLQEEPEKPKLFCTGNQKKIVAEYCKGTAISNEIYGVVGPIVGVSGLILGLAQKQGIPAIAMLAETMSHPFYLGIKGARELLKAINTKLELKINIKELNKEIKKLEAELVQKTKELSHISKETAIKKLEGKFGKEVTYIG